MIEFFVGLLVFAGAITVTGFIFYVIGSFMLKIYFNEFEYGLFEKILFGMIWITIIAGAILFGILFYELGKSILN